MRALAQRQLDIPGPRRQIDDQHVQIAPFHLRDQLLQRPHDHRAAPDHGLVLFQHQPDRHHRHPMRLQGNDRLAIGRGGALGHAHHARLRRAVDIGVQQAHPAAGAGQRNRQIGRDGGFAHPALAAGHRDDPVHPGDALRAALLRRGVLADLQAGRRRLGRRAMRRQQRLHLHHPRQRPQGGLGGGAHRLQRARLIGIGGFDDESHLTALDGQRPHQIPRHQIAAARDLDLRQRLMNRLNGGGHAFLLCPSIVHRSSFQWHPTRESSHCARISSEALEKL